MQCLRHMPASLAARVAALATASLLLGCATTFDNQPLNRPITPEFVRQAAAPRDIVGRDVIGLSLSGGGMRAAAFSFGVLQALVGDAAGAGDVYDDITFISSVSGGSLTAAYVALHGRAGLAHLRERVLLQDLERDLRVDLLSPSNLLRLLAGGLNDRSNLAQRLDTEVFHGATFADLYRRNKPDVWINATDLYNRTPFPFTPQAFLALCSDLPSLRVSEAVAASMAVPLVFAPVVLHTFPDHCLTPLPPRLEALLGDPARVATDPVASVARAMRHYRDATRMRFLKLADGGLTDNQGLSSILVARALSGTAYGPLNEADAVRIRRLLFLIVDAGRPPAGDWALRLDGPSGVDVGVAAADAAIDAATRLSSAAFHAMTAEWRNSIVRYRCALDAATVRRHLPAGEAWQCDDVQFVVETISAEALDPARAQRLRAMPTRLALPAADVDAAIAAGRDATLQSAALRAHLARRGAQQR
ncbi:patatin-like phospholipase family protein [Rubrivivax sp. RP6-9]|uniref:patatin-like phospholipase family protein n=1 Tax=Rubrivivax sp. RP6-9 TaxID=3415750 RepID=UPI003CC693F5